MNDLLQQVQDAHGPSACTVAGGRVRRIEGEATNGQLHDGQTHTPDIGSHGVCPALDPFGGHVGGGTDKGVCNGVDGLGCDTKVAKLDVTPRVDENVGGFDIAMHDPVGFVEIDQATQDGLGDFTQHIDADRAKILGNAIEGTVQERSVRESCQVPGLNDIPAIHVLHAQHNVPRFVLESPVESDDVRAVAVMPDLQLSQDLFPDLLLGVDANDL